MSDSVTAGYYFELAVKEWNKKCRKSPTKKHEHSDKEPCNVWICKHCGKVVYPK